MYENPNRHRSAILHGRPMIRAAQFKDKVDRFAFAPLVPEFFLMDTKLEVANEAGVSEPGRRGNVPKVAGIAHIRESAILNGLPNALRNVIAHADFN
ncbi:hypothetical protein [Burkholderia arboris]|uniref:hypothetical protein n=1 Tax=Burkholderia arboris TaxID=488730 RepID=UPI00210F1575|nr:hypothetical protein [Burkholderia arboris]UTV53304.1 hypothetical protein NLX30_10410 [Burkholderia arboris]